MRFIYFFLIVTLLLSSSSPAAAGDIRDIKGPVFFPANYTLLVILIVAAILIGLYFLFKFLRERKNAPAVPFIKKSAYELACQALLDLEVQDLPSRGLMKEYYILLSNIVRFYIEGRFNMKAPEMTTEEFLFSLKNSGGLSITHKNLLKEFLNLCDAVKFAKYGPTEKEISQSFDIAKAFIDETKQPEAKV